MWLRSLINLALLTGCLATAGQTARRPRNSPTAFDGVYQTNPAPGPGNDAFEWWWFQVVGDVNPATGIVPSFEAIFYLGKTLFLLSISTPRFVTTTTLCRS